MAEEFLSLARKWRPRALADMVGQEYVVRSIQNAVIQKRLHHAYLFSGTRGIGKTTMARILAMLINCEARTADSGEPCRQCSTCTAIMSGKLTDVTELDAASHTQVDKMRELLEGAIYAPIQAPCRVYIIDEVHMLSKSSFNAMLKTLEEPPAHVKFILATTDVQKVPATVRSRCLCFSLLPLTAEQISARLAHILQSEQIEFEAAAATLIGRLANGSLRDGLSILDQAIAHRDGALTTADIRKMTGDTDTALIADILNAIAAGNAEAITEISRRHNAENVDYDNTLMRLANLIYKIAFNAAVPHALPEDESEAALVRDVVKKFDPERLQVLYEIAVRGRRQLPLAPDLITGFEMTLLRMLLFSPGVATPGVATQQQNAVQNLNSAKNLNSPPPVAKIATPPPRPSPASNDAQSASLRGSSSESASIARANSPAAPVAAGHPNPPQTETPSAPAPVAESTALPSWETLTAQMNPSAQALAENCIVREFTADGVQLLLDKSYAHTTKFQPLLEAALKQKFGENFTIEIQHAEDNTATDRRQQRQMQAAQATDTYKDLTKHFPDVSIDPDSVKLTDKGENNG